MMSDGAAVMSRLVADNSPASKDGVESWVLADGDPGDAGKISPAESSKDLSRLSAAVGAGRANSVTLAAVEVE